MYFTWPLPVTLLRVQIFSISTFQTFVDTKIAGKKVVVFSKTYCPFCTKAKKALANYNLSEDDYEVIEIENNPDCQAIQDYLNKLTGGRSVRLKYMLIIFRAGVLKPALMLVQIIKLIRGPVQEYQEISDKVLL